MTPWVTRLLVANVLVYLVTLGSPGIAELLAFQPASVLTHPWTPLTYMFVHDLRSFQHILFNMLSLYFFGPAVEARLGGERFVKLYFASGLMGALLSLLTALFSLASPYVSIVGASGAIFGVMYAFAHFFPHERVYIWGVLPVPARLFVLVMTGLSLLGAGGLFERGVAHYAHLGGFVGGWLYMRWLAWRAPHLDFRRRVERSLRPTGGGSDLDRWGAIRREGLHPLNLEELDRLHAKIGAHGIGSLTREERNFLDRLSLRSSGPGGPGLAGNGPADVA